MIKKVLVLLLVGASVAAMAQNGGGRGGRQGGFGRNNNSLIGLLNRDDVKGELKISDDQKSKLDALRPARGQGGNRGGGGNAGGGNGGGGNGGGNRQGGTFDPEAMRKLQAEREKNTLEVLTADQVKRLKELYVQRVGARAVLREDFQTELKFTPDQKSKIEALQKTQQEANQSVMEKVRSGELERTAVQDIMKKNETALTDELNKVLTADQKAKLKALEGTPFKFDADN
jgi:DNA-directed RNA polymerase beta' subunit